MNKFQLSGVMDSYNSSLLKLIKQQDDEDVNLQKFKVEVKSLITHSHADNLSVVKEESRHPSVGPTHQDTQSLLSAGYKRRIQQQQGR